MPLNQDLATLWPDVDEATGGALYALRWECERNDWTPHVWAQSPREGAPGGLSRFVFFGTDEVGRTVYFDSVLIHDTDEMGSKVKLSQAHLDAVRTKAMALPPEWLAQSLN